MWNPGSEGSRVEIVGGEASEEKATLCPMFSRLKPAEDEDNTKERPDGKENEEGE